MRKLLLAGAAVGALMAASQVAQAGAIVRSFSGSGPSGFLGPGAADEPWSYGCPGGADTGACAPDIGWGSPGVSDFTTTSNELVPVTDFEITFADAEIDPAQIDLPTGCAGISTGGTVFCGHGVRWTTVFTAPGSVAFFAPPGEQLDPGESYFVNVMLLPGALAFGGAFEGAWTAAPEPASLAVLGVGLAGLGFFRRRRKAA